MRSTVREAYATRAREYEDLLGSVEKMQPEDRATISSWAANRCGPVLDAGCGPGHWTGYLHDAGLPVLGVDLVTEFLGTARRRFPGGVFAGASMARLPVATASLDGILAWYSLIHTEPEQVPEILASFARCLSPGGSLLMGFFEGAAVESFDHAITPAYFWPVEELGVLVEQAGFSVVGTARRHDPGMRAHGEIMARRCGP